VLDRFVSATKHLDDAQVIVRLTADNLLPDGRLIDQMIHFFEQEELSYLTSGTKECGLPFGMSIEITRVGLLRESLSKTKDPYDLEHVTPYICRHYGKCGYQALAHFNMTTYRCTIDNLEDYLIVAQLFKGVEDPVGISSEALMEKLALMPNAAN